MTVVVNRKKKQLLQLHDGGIKKNSIRKKLQIAKQQMSKIIYILLTIKMTAKQQQHWKDDSRQGDNADTNCVAPETIMKKKEKEKYYRIHW